MPNQQKPVFDLENIIKTHQQKKEKHKNLPDTTAKLSDIKKLLKVLDIIKMDKAIACATASPKEHLETHPEEAKKIENLYNKNEALKLPTKTEGDLEPSPEAVRMMEILYHEMAIQVEEIKDFITELYAHADKEDKDSLKIAIKTTPSGDFNKAMCYFKEWKLSQAEAGKAVYKWEFNKEKHTVSLNSGTPVKLQPIRFNMLHYLHANAEKKVKLDTLFREGWVNTPRDHYPKYKKTVQDGVNKLRDDLVSCGLTKNKLNLIIQNIKDKKDIIAYKFNKKI